jgi:hypothetical protein
VQTAASLPQRSARHIQVALSCSSAGRRAGAQVLSLRNVLAVLQHSDADDTPSPACLPAVLPSAALETIACWVFARFHSTRSRILTRSDLDAFNREVGDGPVTDDTWTWLLDSYDFVEEVRRIARRVL